MENISWGVALGAGLLSFLSPCVLPLVPVYLASLCGPEIFEADSGVSRATLFLHSLSFVVGFALVFTIMGASAGLAGSVITSNLGLVRRISGAVLIVFGLVMLGAHWLPWLNYEKRFAPSKSRATGHLRSLLTGAIFAPAWTPCVGPLLGSILTLAYGSGTAGYGTGLLAVYSLGLGIPFLAIGAAFNFTSPLLKRLRRYSGVTYILGGVLLIATGILVLTDHLIWFPT